MFIMPYNYTMNLEMDFTDTLFELLDAQESNADNPILNSANTLHAFLEARNRDVLSSIRKHDEWLEKDQEIYDYFQIKAHSQSFNEKGGLQDIWTWNNDDELFVDIFDGNDENDENNDSEGDVFDDKEDEEEEEVLISKFLKNKSQPISNNDSRKKFIEKLNCPQGTEDIILSGIKEAIEKSYTSSNGDDELQGTLLDLLGFDKFDLISEIFTNKADIIDIINSTENNTDIKDLPELTPEFFLLQELNALNDRKSRTFKDNADDKIVLQNSNIFIRSQDEIKREKEYRKQQKKRTKLFKSYHEQAVQAAVEMGYDLDEIKKVLKRAIDIGKSKKSLEELNQRLKDTYGLGEDNRQSVSDLPNVYTNSSSGKYINPSAILSTYGSKFVLPEGSQRIIKDICEEIVVPCAIEAPKRQNERLIPIEELDEVSRDAFEGYTSLNRMQSIVFKTAYTSNENMLVCAPTGAGKTDVAMLTIMNCVKQNLDSKNRVRLDDFKIIYVAPMKALAAEVVRKFSKRLTGSYGINVRELTGDMQLTRAEVRSTQIIVTTPEKLDVITRKTANDDELISKLKLLIIDEVHLLDEDRGAVIETIVARTLRRVEISQSMIRIVGLSATLPNYLDVAEFLSVNIYSGLFFFDSSFRPVPLEQHFIGIKGKGTSQTERMNAVLYEKTVELLEQGAQVMVFVHSRKDTFDTCETLRDEANLNGTSGLFSAEYAQGYENAYKEVQKHAKNKKLIDLFKAGFGMHNAGMLRSDRNLVEKMFEKGYIKVLCCTSTLAWGVNLPAYAVIIKGTQLYDPNKGNFVDLSILDVLQIFGRAGRPQFEKKGVGYILTSYERLQHYIISITQQKPIESQLQSTLIDSLNAEICLNTVSNLEEAVRWLSYTYLNVRMRKNPFHYGMEPKTLKNDPSLINRKREIILDALRRLHYSQMIVFDERSELITPKYLGRIASNYYISQESVMIFNSAMKSAMSEADVLRLVSKSSEFSNLKVRNDEIDDLARMEKQTVHPVASKNNSSIKAVVSAAKGTRGKNSGGSLTDTDKNDPHNRKTNAPGSSNPTSLAEEASTEQKINILLQSYISRMSPSNFALVSDTMYIAQNGSRIIRSLFEMALSRNWGATASILLQLCKSIDKRLWEFEQPLLQFNLNKAISSKVANIPLSIEELREMSSNDLGALVRHQKFGDYLEKCIFNFPLLRLEGKVFPITRTILRVELHIYQDFKWSPTIHNTSEPYWIWVEDGEHNEVLYSEYALLKLNQYRLDLSFVIPIIPRKKKRSSKSKARIDVSEDTSESGESTDDEAILNKPLMNNDDLPNQIYIRAISDRWVGCESILPISFKHLILPQNDVSPHTDLLNLTPLPVSALKDTTLEGICDKRFKYFNPVQTQLFHVLYHTRHNSLIGAPTGSGKTVCAELAMWESFRNFPKSKVVYIAPLKALVKERVADWNKRIVGPMGLKLIELTGDVAPDISAIESSDIIITTPEKWDGVSRSWRTRKYVKDVSLVIIDEIHLLGSERGPTLEVIVSRLNFISKMTKNSIRIIGLSTALANANDLGDWMGIGNVGLYNFRHSVRPVPLEIYIDGFPGKHYCPRMGTMNKPAFSAIKTHSPNQPVIIFVSSRRQTRLTAEGLIALCALETEPRKFLKVEDNDELEIILSQIYDSALKHAVGFGIGLHHAGLIESDRRMVENLYLEGKIQVLIATSTLAWGVNYPAHLVIVKGTEFYDADSKSYVDFPITDVLQMMGRAGRPQFDTSGVACIFVQDIKKNFYKKFLHEPFPVESSLHLYLEEHINAEISGDVIKDFDTARSWLKWTYLHRRIAMNPSYYGLNGSADGDVREWVDYKIGLSFRRLQKSQCIVVRKSKVLTDKNLDDAFYSFEVIPTKFGEIASYYYLQYQSIGRFITGLNYIVQERKKILYSEDDEQEGETLDFEGITYADDEDIDKVWDEDSNKDLRSKNRREQKDECGTLPNKCLLDATKDKPFGGLPDIIFAWSHSTEFARLPVRHNEDLQNKAIAIQLGSSLSQLDETKFAFANALSKMCSGVKILPIPSGNDTADEDKQHLVSSDPLLYNKVTTDVDYLSPFIKTYILLETYLFRRTNDLFTSSDYKTDLLSILDQAVRVIQAIIDIVVELSSKPSSHSAVYRTYGSSSGLPSVLIGTILLLQGIRQARWPHALLMPLTPDNIEEDNNDSDFAAFPKLRGWDMISGFENIHLKPEQSIKDLKRSSISIRSMVRSIYANKMKNDLSIDNLVIKRIISENEHNLSNRHFTSVKNRCGSSLSYLPVVDLDLGISQGQNKELKIEKDSGKVINIITADFKTQFSISVTLSRLNSTVYKNAYTPIFPRSIPEGWFIVAFNVNADMKDLLKENNKEINEFLWKYLKDTGNHDNLNVKILDIKRCSWSNKNQKNFINCFSKININLEHINKNTSIIIGAFSDAYIGLDEFSIINII